MGSLKHDKLKHLLMFLGAFIIVGAVALDHFVVEAAPGPWSWTMLLLGLGILIALVGRLLPRRNRD